MTHLKTVALACLLFGVANLASASEVDELREKARMLQRESAQLAEHGHRKEAAELERRAIAMLEEAEQLERHQRAHHEHGDHEHGDHEHPGHEHPGHEHPGHEHPGHEHPGHEHWQVERMDERHPEIVQLQRHLEELLIQQERLESRRAPKETQQDIRRAIDEVQQRLHQLSREPRHDREFRGDDLARRLEHMRVAVDHLREAGLHDIAKSVADQAEAAEREMHERERHEREMHERQRHEREHHEREMHEREHHEREMREHHQPQHGDAIHEIMRQLEEIHRDMERLRREVNEIRERR